MPLHFIFLITLTYTYFFYYSIGEDTEILNSYKFSKAIKIENMIKTGAQDFKLWMWYIF